MRKLTKRVFVQCSYVVNSCRCLFALHLGSGAYYIPYLFRILVQLRKQFWQQRHLVCDFQFFLHVA